MGTVEPATASHPVLWTMALIHRVIRSGYVELADLVTDVAPDDLSRVEAVADHVEFTLAGLLAHHTTEDDLIWPRLIERAAPQARLIRRMETQHQVIHTAVDHVKSELAGWSAAPSAQAATNLASALNEVIAGLDEHLGEEERDVVPLLAQHITLEEFEEFGQAAFAKFTPKQRFIAMGQLLEVATPAEAAAMFATLPVPVKMIWSLFGKRSYRNYIRRVRGR